MAVNTELAAIIGGCVAGGVLLLAIIACIIYISCGSKRKSRIREKKHFTSLSVSDSGRQSHHSTLSQVDPRALPKVSSNGLWVDAPGVYTPAPASGYYYGRPGQGYRVEQLGVQRSISDRGIPAIPGHAVYQNNMRIYHSQQLAPVYEVIPSGSTGYMNVYEYGDLNHSRSRLLDRDSIDRHRKESKKVKRTQSDVGRGVDKHHRSRRAPDRPSDKHPDRIPERQSSRHLEKQSSHEALHKHRDSQQKSKSMERPADIAVRSKSPTKESPKPAAYDNPAFIASPTLEKSNPIFSQPAAESVKPNKNEVVSSIVSESQVATDSMKLQERKEQRPIINKTDDEKYVVEDGEDINVKHYVYQGSIYAVPSKLTTDEPDGYEENPIVKRMEEMIREKTGENEQSVEEAPTDPIPSVSVSPLYAEPAEVVRESNSLTASKADSRNDDIGESLRETKNKESQSQECHDDLGLKGKNITVEAFQFLDHYLSDEETVESPPMSPVPGLDFAGY